MGMSGRRRASAEQLTLEFPARWGGARAGAGRKRGVRGNVPHRARPRHRAGEPVHVTLRSRLAPLRSQHVFPTVRLALARASRRDPARFRLLHFSVQRDHLHLIVEAADERALSSGVRSVAIRVARYVNDLLARRGPLWADRWHGRPLRTPREVRNALVYVLANFRKHARRTLARGIDPFSSGAWFEGWQRWKPASGIAPPFAESAQGLPRRGTEELADAPIVGPRTWLARAGGDVTGSSASTKPRAPQPYRPAPELRIPESPNPSRLPGFLFKLSFEVVAQARERLGRQTGARRGTRGDRRPPTDCRRCGAAARPPKTAGTSRTAPPSCRARIRPALIRHHGEPLVARAHEEVVLHPGERDQHALALFALRDTRRRPSPTARGPRARARCTSRARAGSPPRS